MKLVRSSSARNLGRSKFGDLTHTSPHLTSSVFSTTAMSETPASLIYRVWLQSGVKDNDLHTVATQDLLPHQFVSARHCASSPAPWPYLETACLLLLQALNRLKMIDTIPGRRMQLSWYHATPRAIVQSEGSLPCVRCVYSEMNSSWEPGLGSSSLNTHRLIAFVSIYRYACFFAVSHAGSGDSKRCLHSQSPQTPSRKVEGTSKCYDGRCTLHKSS